MAKAAGISHTMVGRIWRTFRLQPHRTESFKLSPDPQLVDKIRDVVGLYMKPTGQRRRVLRRRKVPNPGAPTRAADFADRISASPSAEPPITCGTARSICLRRSMSPPARCSRAVRHNTARRTSSHSSGAFDASVDSTLDIHVVLDNLSAHKAPPVQRWLLRHPRVHFHFTPTYASWLNLVERFFGLLTEKALKRGSHTSLSQLRAAILAYVDAHNERGTPFTWVKTADVILDSMRRFGLRSAAGPWAMTRLILEITDPGD